MKRAFSPPAASVSLAIFLALTVGSPPAKAAESESRATAADDDRSSIRCEGVYPKHLQGVCRDEAGNFYWSWTTSIVKTDPRGAVLARVEAPSHQGDLCFARGALYVAVNLGKFNQPAGQADSWVYRFDAETLELLDKFEVQEAVHGAGGIEFVDGRFFVVGGLPEDHDRNYVYEYAPDFRFVKRHEVPSGWTKLGIQTASFQDGHWWFGCYGAPAVTLKVSRDFQEVSVHEINTSYGLVPSGKASRDFLVATNRRAAEGGHAAELRPATLDEETLAKSRVR